jgi:hypothetical protein
MRPLLILSGFLITFSLTTTQRKASTTALGIYQLKLLYLEADEEVNRKHVVALATLSTAMNQTSQEKQCWIYCTI